MLEEIISSLASLEGYQLLLKIVLLLVLVMLGVWARGRCELPRRSAATHTCAHGDCEVPRARNARAVLTSLAPIPVIGSIARGTQRLSCSMRGSMEPRIEHFSR